MMSRIFLLSLICCASQLSAWNTPVLVSPANASTTNGGVTLNWNSVSGSAAYQFQYDTSALFNSPVLSQGTHIYINSSSGNSDTQQQITSFYYGTTYYWRVRAFVAGDTSAWSNAWTFMTPSTGPSHVSPANGLNNAQPGYTFDWNSHNYVSAYDWQIDTTATFTSPALKQGSKTYINTSGGNTDTEITTGDLYYGKTHYWRVRSRNAVDTSEWTTAWTIAVTPDGPSHVSPANGLNNAQPGYTFDWNSHNYVSAYDWQIDTTATFTSPALKQGSKTYINTSGGNTDTEITTGDLYYGKTHYWRVRSRNAVDTSEWTAAWTIAVTNYGPSLVSPANGALNISTTSVTLNWNAHNYVQKYELQIDTNNQFNTAGLILASKNYINTSNGNTDTQHALTSLSANTIYYWRVRSLNNADTSDWTQSWAFNTGSNPVVIPVAPLLISPSSGAIALPVNGITIDWDAVNGVGYYEYEIDTLVSFASSWKINGYHTYISPSGANTDTEFALPLLEYNKTYYWRVRTGTSSAISPWSAIWNFTTDSAITTGFSTDVPKPVSIFPNPANELITIESAASFVCRIIDISGKVIATADERMSKVTFDIRALEHGVYIVEICGDAGTSRHKFLKR